MEKIKTLGILTGGGDCPGMNAVIRAAAKTAINDYNLEVIGIKDGYEGLVEKQYQVITLKDASGILTLGGTILGTSNCANPFAYPVKEGEKTIYRDCSGEALNNLKDLGIEALICIGGDGTLSSARDFSHRGAKIVGVPKTIDNDLSGTDLTFGFDSAVATATEAIDKIHTTAISHHRVMVIEVMGRYAGWLALASGLAGGGDIILIPEIPYRMGKICQTVLKREKQGKRFSIVVVAEGAYSYGGKVIIKRIIKNSPDEIRLGGVGNKVAAEIEKQTGIATRITVLGHLIRGGTPTAFDRILATRFGSEAVHLVMKGKFGRMVSLKGKNIVSVPLEEAVGKLRTVPLDSPLLKVARSLGVCMGD